MNKISNSIVRILLNDSSNSADVLSKPGILVYVDSPLKKAESNFLLTIFEKAAVSNANFFFEASALLFLNEFFGLTMKHPQDALKRIFILSESLDNLPFNQIAIRNRGIKNDIIETIKTLVLLLDVDIYLLIFKAEISKKLHQLLSFFSDYQQTVFAIPASPFSKEYSGNTLALREGATSVTAPSDILDFINFQKAM